MGEAMSNRVVIIGAGHGGANAAALLRQRGYEGDVVLLSDESEIPYQRPPLSKDFLKAELPSHELVIKPGDFYEEQSIDLRLDVAARSIDPARREVLLDDGERLTFDDLILATGASPRRLPIPGASLEGICTLRNRSDADYLAHHLQPGARIVIVGGGYIGLEVAASARHRGAHAVVLEREPRVLARVASGELADWLTAHHRDQGTEIFTGTEIAGFEDDGAGHVAAVLTNHGRFECDVALVGVGAAPNDQLAQEAGLPCDGGVVVDRNAWTGVDGIFAIGDVTSRPLEHFDGQYRLESIPSAVEQAKQAVSAILGSERPKSEVPWFWSDQFDVKVKIAGLVNRREVTVQRGDSATGKFALFHCAGDKVVAVESVNSASDFMAGKQFIDRDVSIDVVRLADDAVSLRELTS